MTDLGPAGSRAGGRRIWLLIAACVLALHAGVFWFVCDDAFITFRYAENWVRHGEPVFNPGERVEGYSNFLWMALTALVIRCGGSPAPASQVLGLGAALLTLLALARHAAFLGGGRSRWDAAGPLLLAAWPAFACWSTGGLETSLFTLLVTLGWTAYLRELEGEGPCWPLSGLWLGLAALTRPEGPLVFAALGLHLTWCLARQQRLPGRREALWLAGFLVVFLPHLAWRWSFYGSPVPHSYHVKGVTTGWAAGWAYLRSWTLTHHLWLAGLLALAAGGSERRRGFLGLAALLVGLQGLHVARVGGDFMALHRFMVPVMPPLALAAALGIRRLAERYRESQGGRLVVGTLAAGALLLLGTAVREDGRALRVEHRSGVDSIGLVRLYAHRWSEIGWYLAETTPARTRIATGAAGAIPYYSRLPTLDLFGLNDPWIAGELPRSSARPGHGITAPTAYVRERGVQRVLWVAPDPPTSGTHLAWEEQGYAWRAESIDGEPPIAFGYWERRPPAVISPRPPAPPGPPRSGPRDPAPGGDPAGRR